MPDHHRHSSKKPFFRNINIILVIFVAACLLLALLASLGVFQQEKIVSFETMKKYAKDLIINYNQRIDFFLPPTYDQFSFYSNKSYDVTAIRSSSHGTALLLYPSAEWSFQEQQTNERIEDAVFGEYNSQLPTKFIFTSNYTGITGNNGSIIDVGFIVNNDSSAIFTNINKDSVYFFCIILKGNNATNFWNSEFAINDSKHIFDGDLYTALEQSEEVRERYAEPELNALLLNILSKWSSSLQPHGDFSYTFTQKEYDIKQVEEVAKTKYGISNASEFIDNLINYLEKANLPPAPLPKTIFNHVVNDPDNWAYVTLLGVLPICIYITYLAFDYLRKKTRSRVSKYMLAIPPTVLCVALGDLVLGYPYDYQFLSVQTLIVITIWILGITGMYEGKKRLTIWRTNKPKNFATNNSSTPKT